MKNFVIITPAKDEAGYIRYTLESVCYQTLKPRQWVIVDDGSTDDTPEIVKEYLNQYEWITLVERGNAHEERMGGGKVVRAFYKGFETVATHDYDFIVKLDADLSLPHDYFAEVSKAFERDDRIGLAGGYCVEKRGDDLVKPRVNAWHLRGAIKAYRRECFEEIGGLKEIWNWDGMDEMTAMYKGWKIEILPLEVIHHRFTSSSYNHILHSFQSGKEKYREGDDLVLALVRSLVRFKRKPFLISGLAFGSGYVYALFSRPLKHVDKDLQKFIRSFHYNRIFKGIRAYAKQYLKG